MGKGKDRWGSLARQGRQDRPATKQSSPAAQREERARRSDTAGITPRVVAAARFDPTAIGKAGVVTGFMVLGITAVAFTTKKDFSFLGGFLKIGCLIALGLIVASIFMGFSLGIWFSAAMVLVASCSILYNTSQIMYHYAPGQHVAAALSLFASVALLFWYVLRLFMNRD